MLKTRVISGVILAPLFLALVYFEAPYFNLLIAAISGVMAWEFMRMDGKAGIKRRALITVAVLAAVAVASLHGPLPALLVTAAGTIALVVADQIGGRKGRHTLQIAILYVAVPAVSLLYVMDVGGSLSVFWMLAVVWATDIGAYAFGRTLGGPKLAPKVSPNKTWSGALGGLVCAVLASLGLLIWATGLPVTAALVGAAASLSIVSQAGDLFESALKRRYQVKDSGGIIPGHGGVMDRFDGLWAAAPVGALFCWVGGSGVSAW